MQSTILLKLFTCLIVATSSCYTANKNYTKTITESTANPKFQIIVQYDTLAFAIATDTILYKPNNKLIWSDFKAAPILTSESVANSSVGFKYAAAIVQTDNSISVTVFVSTFFVKTKSWKKQNSATSYILQHEQRHFDIARYGVQLFANAIAGKKMDIKNFNKILQTTYAETWQNYLKLQNQYDTETNHSINKTQQELWNTKINNYLAMCK